MSRDAFEHVVSKHSSSAAEHCPSIKAKKLSPHVLRHTTAMQLLPVRGGSLGDRALARS